MTFFERWNQEGKTKAALIAVILLGPKQSRIAEGKSPQLYFCSVEV